MTASTAMAQVAAHARAYWLANGSRDAWFPAHAGTETPTPYLQANGAFAWFTYSYNPIRQIHGYRCEDDGRVYDEPKLMARDIT